MINNLNEAAGVDRNDSVALRVAVRLRVGLVNGAVFADLDNDGYAELVLAMELTGSSYLSQASSVQVLGLPRPPTRLMVRWPGGRVHRAAVPDGAEEIRVDLDGRVEQIR